MKSCAVDFREKARKILEGKWIYAVFVGLVAALLGAPESESSGIKISWDTSTGLNMDFNLAGWKVFSENIVSIDGSHFWLGAGILYAVILALLIGIFFYILGRIIEVGYMKFNLDLYGGREAEIQTLFGQFSNWKTIVVSNILRDFYEFVGLLLLIIPGIIIGYNYAMTDYILVEHPEMSATEAMKCSKEMMYGNRYRLFCLELSFIGWIIVCIFTMGIGNLWLRAYTQAAKTAFYREISGTDQAEDVIDGFSEDIA